MRHVVYLILSLLYLIFLDDFCEVLPYVVMHLCNFLFQSSNLEQTLFRLVCETYEGIQGHRSRLGYLYYFLGYSCRPFQYSLVTTVFVFFAPRWTKLKHLPTEKI